jgi:hypothetical protein
MMTIRQIERLWNTRSYNKLLDELLSNRWEGEYYQRLSGSPALLAAAISMIRLDELNQSCSPIFGILLRTLLAAQESDGGWEDLAVTAVCLRALVLDRGTGPAVERGIAYLAALQQSQGSWPVIPIRRMQADSFTTAFVLLELGESTEFRRAVRWTDAINWLATQETEYEVQGLWQRVRLRCRVRPELTRAGDGIRTHDVSLGKAAFYH